MSIPKYDELFNPVLNALKALGDSASIAELDTEVLKHLNLSEEEVAQPHNEGGKPTTETELEYRLAWARTYLKGYGLINNSARGIWVVTPKGKEADKVEPQQVIRFYREQSKNNKQIAAVTTDGVPAIDSPEIPQPILQLSWKEQLLETLLVLKPDAFERLCQLLLRESGFTQVKVTGRSGDGGIDGVGLVQLGGLLSFPVLFQCKRYQGSIGPSTIRDFRGAMIGRSDRGLVITTGTFSPAAKQEATRDGAPPIDLVDGEQLIERLKDLRLGVEVKMIEDVTVKPEWFKEI